MSSIHRVTWMLPVTTLLLKSSVFVSEYKIMGRKKEKKVAKAQLVKIEKAAMTF